MATLEKILTSYTPISATTQAAVLCYYCRPNDMNDLSATDYLKLAIAEFGFIATTVLGIIETIFWTSILLLCKAIHVFMPESQIADRIFTQLVVNTGVTIGATTVSALMLGYNFSLYPHIFEIINNIVAIEMIELTKDYLLCPINYRLFTDSAIVILKPVKDNECIIS